MGYAMKLKQVNFSSVAVDKVNYIIPVPCTGISLNPSSLTFDTAEETKNVVATITPSDTTDTLLWASSNENVATVSDGAVTIHGIGTATITATCGEQTATISITQTELKAPYVLTDISGKYVSLYTGDNGKVLKQGSIASQHIIGQPYHADNIDLHILKSNASGVYENAECIRVPYGATKAKIKTTDDQGVSISYNYIVDTTELVIVGSDKYPKFVSENTFINTNTGLSCNYGQAVVFRPTDAQVGTLSYVYFT